MTLIPVVLGAPGVIYVPDLPPVTLPGVPMDVAAFAGVAPRGPAWEPVDPSAWPVPEGLARMRSVPIPVESWDDYVDRFGSFDGPGLLPYAVASFFQQGGRRAYVVRIVHHEAGVATGALPPPGRSQYTFDGVTGIGGAKAAVSARNEGRWGDRLNISLSFATVPVAVARTEPSALALEPQAQVTVGAWLRLVLADGMRLLRVVNEVVLRGRLDGPGYERLALLDGPVAGQVHMADRVDAVLDVVDEDPLRTRREHFEGLGLLPGHPAWLGDVLAARSTLVELAAPAGGIELTDPALPGSVARLTAGGEDRYRQIVSRDVFGTLLEGDDTAADGLDVLLRVPEVASIVVPDLYSPSPLPPAEPVFDAPVSSGATFAECPPPAPAQTGSVPPAGLDGLRLDPASPLDLERIIDLQLGVVAYAEKLDAVALLDVPPRLRQRAVMTWRSRFDSSHAAGYHPWLRIPPGQGGRDLVDLPPSAAAAGIVARTELLFGVPHGPANEPVVGAVDVTDRVDESRHAELHQAGIDVFRIQPDAVWLMGARTVSADRTWRQLSVRRVVSLLERTVRQELQWTVFEPDSRALRTQVEMQLGQLLSRLFLQGAFGGATPAQSYFVRTAGEAALAAEVDAGQLLCEIGVAPAEPLEFIVVRIARTGHGALLTETFHG